MTPDQVQAMTQTMQKGLIQSAKWTAGAVPAESLTNITLTPGGPSASATASTSTATTSSSSSSTAKPAAPKMEK